MNYSFVLKESITEILLSIALCHVHALRVPVPSQNKKRVTLIIYVITECH